MLDVEQINLIFKIQMDIDILDVLTMYSNQYL